MPTMNRASAWVLVASLGFAGSVAAQGQQPPQVDPKVAVPATVTPAGAGQQAPRIPSAGSGRNQFFTPVMSIDIKGDGLALPAGVAQPDEPLIPPAKPPAEPPPATAK
jgi:hypothetical protein